VFLHVLFRQLDSDSEDADGENDARDFERDLVTDGIANTAVVPRTPPGAGIEEPNSIGTYDDAKYGREGSFADVELLLDEQREHAKDNHEGPQHDVPQMDGIDLKRIKSHVCATLTLASGRWGRKRTLKGSGSQD